MELNWLYCSGGSFFLSGLAAYLVYAAGAKADKSVNFHTWECFWAVLSRELPIGGVVVIVAFGFQFVLGSEAWMLWMFLGAGVAVSLAPFHYLVLLSAHRSAREERRAKRRAASQPVARA